MSEGICNKHKTGVSDEAWQVALEELTESGDWPFEGQVCPVCFEEIAEKLKKSKRALKVESKSAVRLRRENSELKGILDAVMAAIYNLTGEDPAKLAEKRYDKVDPSVPGGALAEHGDLRNILPNLITELANKKKE